MTRGELIIAVCNAFPITKLDVDSEREAIRFEWKGRRFRVTPHAICGGSR